MAQASTPARPNLAPQETRILKQVFAKALDEITASHRIAVMKAFHAELGAELKTQGAATAPSLLPAAHAAKPAARSGTPATATKPSRSAAAGEGRANGTVRKSRPRSAAWPERAAPSPEGRAIRTTPEGRADRATPEQHANGAAAA